MFGKRAKIVFLGFDNAKNYLKNVNTIFTGNPIHIKPFIEISMNIDFTKKTLLIIGGSQGSEFLNHLISDGIEKDIIPNINIVWLVGENNFDKYKNTNLIRSRYFLLLIICLIYMILPIWLFQDLEQ